MGFPKGTKFEETTDPKTGQKVKEAILPDGTVITGDIDRVEILEYFAYTEKGNASDGLKKIGDGFIHGENATRYIISGYAKNIADKTLDRIELTIKYHDVDGILLGSQKQEHSANVNGQFEFFFMCHKSYGFFEKVDQVSFSISVL